MTTVLPGLRHLRASDVRSTGSTSTSHVKRSAYWRGVLRRPGSCPPHRVAIARSRTGKRFRATRYGPGSERIELIDGLLICAVIAVGIDAIKIAGTLPRGCRCSGRRSASSCSADDRGLRTWAATSAASAPGDAAILERFPDGILEFAVEPTTWRLQGELLPDADSTSQSAAVRRLADGARSIRSSFRDRTSRFPPSIFLFGFGNPDACDYWIDLIRWRTTYERLDLRFIRADFGGNPVPARRERSLGTSSIPTGTLQFAYVDGKDDAARVRRQLSRSHRGRVLLRGESPARSIWMRSSGQLPGQVGGGAAVMRSSPRWTKTGRWSQAEGGRSGSTDEAVTHEARWEASSARCSRVPF